jgi:hypothetical protein
VRVVLVDILVTAVLVDHLQAVDSPVAEVLAVLAAAEAEAVTLWGAEAVAVLAF